MRLRLPPPLVCAVLLAATLALCGSRARTVPSGANPDDRGDDRIAGVIGGPLVRTPLGVGAPLHAEGTTIWLWADRELRPGERVVAYGRLRTPRGMLAPGATDR